MEQIIIGLGGSATNDTRVLESTSVGRQVIRQARQRAICGAPNKPVSTYDSMDRTLDAKK
ncbi:glycerate kinase [Vibrio chagasii]|nr:glycerate kinase [Vibrio chagasii]